MRLIVFFCILWGGLSSRAESPECTIHYQNYSQMEWVRWAVSTSDYKSTNDFLSLKRNQTILRAKGYKIIPEKLFIYDDIMSFLGLHQGRSERAHSIRILSDGSIKIYKLTKFKDEAKPRLFHVTYENLDQVPNCNQLQNTILSYKIYRDLYLTAYDYYNSGSIGLAFIHLETIAKLKKKQSVDISQASRNYRSLLQTLDQKIMDLKTTSTFVDKISLVREHLLMGSLTTYSRSQTSIIDALKSNSANCVGNTALLVALINDLRINLDRGFEFGVEIFQDHVQFVIVNKEKKINWDILSNSIDQNFDTPVLKIKSFARSALIRTQVKLFPEDKNFIEPIQGNDFIFVTKVLNQPEIIAPDKIGKNSSSFENELSKRIDIFEYEYGYQMSVFSNQPVSETASNSHLIGRNLTSTSRELNEILNLMGISSLVSDTVGSVKNSISFEPSSLSSRDIGPTMYDDEAVRVYTDVIKKGRSTPESISKYGFQHITKYFPKNHIFHDWADKHAMYPLHLGNEWYDSTISFSNKGIRIVFESKSMINELKSQSYIDRFHSIFKMIISPFESFKEVMIPSIIRAFDSDSTVEEVLKISKALKVPENFNGCENHSFFILVSEGRISCSEFLNYNVPGLAEANEELNRSLEKYYLNKLKNLNRFVVELNQTSSKDLSSFFSNLKKLQDLTSYKGRVSVDHLMSWTLSFLLRNPDNFYTSEPTAEEKALEKELTDYVTGKQTLSFDSSKLPSVDVPKVQGISDCNTWTGHGSTVCAVSRLSALKNKQKLIRKVVIIKPHILPYLLLYGPSLRSDNQLFLMLTWKSSNTKAIKNYCASDGAVPCMLGGWRYNLNPYSLQKPDIEFSEVDKERAFKSCNAENTIDAYLECGFKVAKKRFSHQVQLSEPSWMSKDPVLQSVRDVVRQMSGEGKFENDESVQISQKSLILDNYKSIPISKIYSANLLHSLQKNFPEDGTLVELQAKLDGLSPFDYKILTGFSKNDLGFLVGGTSLINSREIRSISIYRYFFLRKGNLYISENHKVLSDNEKIGYLTHFTPHVDPVEAIDIITDFKNNYPELYELDQSLL